MNIALNINGQFGRMTGVQQYVDCLIGALYNLRSPHRITAFAPALVSMQMLEQAAQDGRFGWRSLPNAHIDAAGSAFTISDSSNSRFAAALDRHIVSRVKGRTSRLRAIRASRKYDVIHVPEAHILDFTDYQPKRFVATIYDLTTVTIPTAHSAENIAVWQRYYDFVKSCCARVITISEFSKRDIVTHLGIAPDRIDVTPLAARASAGRVENPAALAQTLEKIGLLNVPFVLYSGTLEPRKNLMRLLEAFAAAVADAGLHEHRLVLAGGHWADHDQELRARAASLGIGERVILTGYVSNADMNALMSSCEAFAYVSEYEGFGLPPLEAMVCGAPVVSSNTTSLPEVVGDAGLQVDPLDVDAIAGALRVLLTDAQENRRRRGLSLAHAQEFSWERTARLTLETYEKAAAA